MSDALKVAALEYHESPRPGKISVVPTKGLTNQRDLALAYSPGVAYACKAIEADPTLAAKYTSRANLVGVVTNGSAVLGLGNIGPLAGKPVMEGKACLFKKFAGIDVFDIELAETDPDKLVDIIAALEPTLGGINLEDIKAPECFYIEKKLKEKLKIPVFHDDQHGTAIIVGAAIINGLKVVGKNLRDVRVVCSGAGAAAIACLNLLITLGIKKENIIVCDSKGVISTSRAGTLDENKAIYAIDTPFVTIDEAMRNADIFLGLSGPGTIKKEWIAEMADKPLVLALANPIPEIMPEEIKSVRPDAVIATGRSDYPNQVNNVLCFPFIFRGALDVGATKITEEMKLACVYAIAELAQAERSDVVASAYEGQELSFGPEYIIPTPFDPRLITLIAPAVAQAAMNSGVATLPIQDMAAYRDKISNLVYQTGFVMKPVFEAAKADLKRVIYAEGEDERVLQAVQAVSDEKLCIPILIGRPDVIKSRIERAGLRIKAGEHFEVVNPENDERFKETWSDYYQIMRRKGVSPEDAKTAVRTSTTLIGAMLVRRGDADALICGSIGRYQDHLKHVNDVIGREENASIFAAMNLLPMQNRTLFISDTYVNHDPSAQEIAEITIMAADEVKRFGLAPKVALVSHSNFGTEVSPSATKMSDALDIIEKLDPSIEIDGEMHGDAALNEMIRNRIHPDSKLKGEANLLIMPTVEAANIAYNLLKMVSGDGITVGPILLGARRAVHIVTPTVTVRRIVNMTALASVDATSRDSEMLK
ncbi:MAG: NADP-dependent malic enzyme [Burkholderiales bacterium]|jgi:malate dehydrogenase (oxaloacetate-decarboxylating)(NADP+)|nr:NADP-dependent malic enzyme [Burkholderiales bacterium]MBL6878747.1 NADP-dependent malic enzyme [Burkholderiales bacterium]MCH1424648.1 NADP-dependent malic enzyme [Burkholderiales bacterium]